jgi:chromosome segregation ATPase
MGSSDSATDTSEEGLLLQVPAELRQKVYTAEFDLEVAQEKAKLAEQKKELASLREKNAGYEDGIAKNDLEQAQLALDIAKLEAIDESGLGEKEDTINKLADLKTKKLKIEVATVKLDAKRQNLEYRIQQLSKEVQDQEEQISNLVLKGKLEPKKGEQMDKGAKKK